MVPLLLGVFALLTFLNLIEPTHAIYASQAGNIDWHEQYIGVPFIHSTAIQPRFHRIGAGKHAQAIYLSATESNVLAALNPSEGNVVWRRQFEENDNLVAFKANSDGLVSLSGYGGATVRLFEVVNGNLIWETPLHDPATGHLAGSTPDEPTGAAIEFDAVDVFILSNGHTVRRLKGNGETLWGWTSPDMGSSVFLTHLVRTEAALYVLGVSKGFSSLSIHITSLDPATGALLHSATLHSSINSHSSFIPLKLGIPSNGPPIAKTAAIAYLESGSVKQVLLTPTLDAKYLNKPAATKYGPFSKIEDLGIAERGYVVALLEGKEDTKGAAHIYRLDPSGLGMNKSGEFGASSAKTPWTVYAAGLDRKGEAYIAKFAHSSTLRSASYEVFAPSAVHGQGMMTGFTFDYNSNSNGAIQFAAIDVVNTAEYMYASRIIMSTTTGTIMQWLQDQNSWNREESLTEIEFVKGVDLPELSRDDRVLYMKGEESWPERLVKQLGDIKGLPSFVFHWFQRFLTGKYISPTSASMDAPGSLWRDTYGFKKVIVVATKRGTVFGIESVKGKVLWAIKLGARTDLKMSVKPLKMVVLKTVSEGLHPEVGLVVDVKQIDSKGVMFTSTGVVRIDAVAGTSQSIVLFRGPCLEAMELDLPVSSTAGFGRKLIGVVDENYKVHIFPQDPETVESFNNITEKTSFLLSTGSPTEKSLQGYGLNPLTALPPASTGDAKSTWDSYPAWRSSFPPGERIISVTRRIQGAPVSHGRVLADQSTLYKYSNPHLIAVVTESHVRTHHDTSYASKTTPKARCTVYLVDSMKGSILYESSVGSERGCDIKVALVENWLVWNYYEDGSNDHTGGTKGWRMVSAELYEGQANKKTRSVELAKDHLDRAAIVPIEQVFIFPGEIKALTMTTTKFGISSKDVVVINSRGQVQTFSRRFLDPRRPKTKPSAAEAELGLVQYDVLLPSDPRRIVSHNYHILVSKLATMPTQLESTSLVFAYGLDMFLTRVAPSGTFDVLSEGFNKIQLVCTAMGLAVAIVVTNRLVKSRALKAKWYP